MIAFLVISAVLLLLYIYGQRKPKGFPPGPWGFPILGHLPLLGLEAHKTAMAWKPKYGPIVGLNFASYPCVIISDHKLIREAYGNSVFNDRPKLPYLTERCGGIQPEGLLSTSGRAWVEQRTFTHKRLRQLGGFGTRSMESAIIKQQAEFLHLLRQKVGQPVTSHTLFNVALINALWAIISSKPFDQTDPEVIQIAETVVDALAGGNIVSMLSMFIPWFADYFPNWITRKSDLERQYNPVIKFFRPHVEERWRTHVAGQSGDLMDSYIDEVKSTTDPESSFHISRSHNSLVTTLLDLFLGGIETGGATLAWFCIYMVRFPQVQEKFVAEIMSVLGPSRTPTLEDRRVMPYAEAVLHEILRMNPLLPFAVFHSPSETVQLQGYTIPKDTITFINIYEAHFNEEYWGDPKVFRPERWLSEDESEFVRHDAFMAFSVGKRACLGEQLIRDEAFLFTVGLLQKFKVNPDPNGPLPDLNPKLGGSTIGPKHHTVVFTLRDE